MRIPIINMDSVGIIQDVLPHDLPVNAWSGGKNVRFKDRRVEKIGGYQKAFTPSNDVTFAMPANFSYGAGWIQAGNSTIYVYFPDTNINEDYTSSITSMDALGLQNGWTGGWFNGISVLNHVNSGPWFWNGIRSGANFERLTGWDPNWRCRSLRPFKNYLVSLGTVGGALNGLHNVLWSHPADPGTLPSSWDYADPTKDAGLVERPEGNTYFVDQMPLRGANIIYKTDRAFAMRHIGGIDIFRFDPILGVGFGLLVPNGVQTFVHRGEHHIVFGQHDIYVHDGQTVTSILRGKMRDWLYNNIDPIHYGKSHIAHNIAEQEMYVCFPSQDSTQCNMALVWNYGNNSTTFKELPNIGFMVGGRVATLNDASAFDTFSRDQWDEASGTMDSENLPWGFARAPAFGNQLLSFTHGAGRSADVHDTASTFIDDPFESSVERVGLNVLGKDMNGQPIFDTDSVKIVTEVWPRFRGNEGTVIDCYVGTQSTIADPVAWQGPYPFRIGIDEKVTPYCSGKIISVRFTNLSDSHWDCAGYDLEIVGGGKY